MRPTITRLVTVLVVLLAAVAVEAQQPGELPRIGYLAYSAADRPYVDAFRQGLRELGYVEGQNILIEWRFVEGRVDRLPEFSSELVNLKVQVIVVAGATAVRAVQSATTTIPIVMAYAGDPVGVGFAASLAHPGGNITGLTTLSPELGGKRLEILKELVPRASRVAVLWNPTVPERVTQFKETQVAARALGTHLQSLEVRAVADFDKAFQIGSKGHFDALITMADPLIVSQRTRILDFAAKSRLPAIYQLGADVDAGGLMSYGPSISDMFRRAAAYVDKILKGAKPGDLPIEQPTKFELVINLKTAKALGLTIPPSLLLRADRSIK